MMCFLVKNAIGRWRLFREAMNIVAELPVSSRGSSRAITMHTAGIAKPCVSDVGLVAQVT